MIHDTLCLRKLYGLLESPPLPPSIPTHQFKLFLVGRTGSGKTCLVSWLAGLPGWNYTMGESPGVRVTQVSSSWMMSWMYHHVSSFVDLLAVSGHAPAADVTARHVQAPLLGRWGLGSAEVQSRVPGMSGGSGRCHTDLLIHGQNYVGGASRPHTADAGGGGGRGSGEYFAHCCRNKVS